MLLKNDLIKNDIKKYYKDKKAIKWHYSNIERLNKRLNDIEYEMKNPLIFNSINTDIKAISYDRINIKSNSTKSNIDIQIDNMYKMYENEKARIINEIFITQNIINNLDCSIQKFDFYINMIDDEIKNIIELRFMNCFSITSISFKLNMSKSSVSRKIDYGINTIYKLYCEYENI